MRKLAILVLFVFSLAGAQSLRQQERAIRKFQKELNSEYRNKKTSPLRGENFQKFRKHPFFPVNLKYRVTAHLQRTMNAQPFDIPTSSGKTKAYIEYGKVTFSLDGNSYILSVFQSLDLRKKEEYKDYLFLPFRDLTNGTETYGGGKYMDLWIPEGDELVLDFNQSYQPYCAYNAFDYNCPIVPEGNRLPIRIEAGVKYDDVYFH